MPWEPSFDPSNYHPPVVRSSDGRRLQLDHMLSEVEQEHGVVKYCVSCGAEFWDFNGYTKCEICSRFRPRAAR